MDPCRRRIVALAAIAASRTASDCAHVQSRDAPAGPIASGSEDDDAVVAAGLDNGRPKCSRDGVFVSGVRIARSRLRAGWLRSGVRRRRRRNGSGASTYISVVRCRMRGCWRSSASIFALDSVGSDDAAGRDPFFDRLGRFGVVFVDRRVVDRRTRGRMAVRLEPRPPTRPRPRSCSSSVLPRSRGCPPGGCGPR